MDKNNPTKKQLEQAQKAARFMINEKMPLDSLQWLATIDPIFYSWLRIEQIQYKRLGGVYGENESDTLHNKAGDFAYYLIEQSYKNIKKEIRNQQIF